MGTRTADSAANLAAAPVGKSRKSELGALPVAVFLSVVGLVCLALAANATYQYFLLSQLREEYMQRRGREMAAALDLQSRGPGRRSNLSVWQSLLKEAQEKYADQAMFFLLVDGSGQTLAQAGDADAAQRQADAVYPVETELLGPRPSGAEIHSLVSDWRVRVGMRRSSTDFLMKPFVVHILITAVAIATLLVLAVYQLRTLRRFLELKTRQESERHLAALGKMAATLAHEIRNPLGAVKGLIQVVQVQLPKEHQSQALMSTVVSEAQRLERLVHELLEFARPRRLQVSELDLSRLLLEVHHTLQPRLEQAGVRMELAAAEPMLVRSDENGLRQVLLNVLINALEATPAGEGFTVMARSSAEEKGAVIEVNDPGAGLGDEDSEELFEPFVTTKLHGTGLGLSISRRILDNLGGSIRLANRAGGGARCTIRLPLIAQA